MTPSACRGGLAAAAPLLAALVCAPAPARAQTSEQAEAQRLFLEGRAAVERGDYATGCPKFVESLRLVNRASTLLNLAQCEEKAGRLRAALDYWNQGAAQLDPTDERLKLARERAADLDARIPRITVRFTGKATPGTAVKLDSAPLRGEDIGVDLPVEPGSHEVVLAVPGQPDQRLSVDLEERERKELLLQAGAGAPRVVLAGDAGPGRRRTLGFIVGGVGVAGLAAAGITGALIVSRDAEIQEQCPGQRCSQTGTELIRGATPLLVGNAVAWGIGIVGIGAGAWLLLSGGGEGARATPATAIRAAPLPGGAALSLRRSF